MNILVTGCAGFIGFSFSKYLLEKNNKKRYMELITSMIIIL